jgi:AbiV family abortive infection protein
LREEELHGPATSLAVLALEEVGKMILLDGLLFAKTGDERHEHFTKGHLAHRSKLRSLEIYPVFLVYLRTMDPRRAECAFRQATVVALTDLKKKRERIGDVFGAKFPLMDLDALKQKGFYSHQRGTQCCSNMDGITRCDRVGLARCRLAPLYPFEVARHLPQHLPRPSSQYG